MQPKILLVDDSHIQQEMLKLRLQKEDLTVTSCDCGAKALDILKTESFDLLLLDLQMPEMDGYEVLHQVRSSISYLNLPVIIITADEDPASIVKAFELGANDYINKEVSFKIAMQRIRTQLKIKSLAEQSIKSSQMQAIHAMIVTYNHEINNPLAIAYGNLGNEFSELAPDKFNKAVKALERIKILVQKIQELDIENVEFSHYSENCDMLKLKT